MGLHQMKHIIYSITYPSTIKSVMTHFITGIGKPQHNTIHDLPLIDIRGNNEKAMLLLSSLYNEYLTPCLFEEIITFFFLHVSTVF